MQHKNYFVFKAKNNYELGLMMGTHFADKVSSKLNKLAVGEPWGIKVDRSKKYLEATSQYFPEYIKEMEGYADGAEVNFDDFWTMSLEDEFDSYKDHCTSVIANKGNISAHNEDWNTDSADSICVVQKIIGNLSLFELHYISTLGGNSVSINSYGNVQLINSLTHKDWQIGVPRNVIARFMSETKDPDADFARLKKVKRSMGYNHNIISKSGKVWNIECSAKEQVMVHPDIPFVHTNHYLTDLKTLEAESSDSSSFTRYDTAKAGIKSWMKDEKLISLMSDESLGSKLSIFNERTIARALINLEEMCIKVWLSREADAGWVTYSLTSLFRK